ncbi:hypothetical protein SCLCIDRAFT_27178 [Scleroderma citrinum Foug A]|uniref:Uncharacterized protein n=1 Tax=Scleroderma citrinum Foug A TaxID=1036808 RepID=A0A0C2ZCX5_9AGAM|nr:hypothetical protein SCLCIDRAFT_27178 [Scleroderma citrinum Foug A]
MSKLYVSLSQSYNTYRLGAAARSRRERIGQRGGAYAVLVYIHGRRGRTRDLRRLSAHQQALEPLEQVFHACPPAPAHATHAPTHTGTLDQKSCIHVHTQALTPFDAADPTIVNAANPFEPTTTEPKPHRPASLPLRTHTSVLVFALRLELHTELFEDLSDALHDLGRQPRSAVPAVAAEAAEADATSEDVVNRHPAPENEKECRPDVAHSRQAFHVWLDTTALPEPLHDIAGLDSRRRTVARRVCILATHAWEDGRLAMACGPAQATALHLLSWRSWS